MIVGIMTLFGRSRNINKKKFSIRFAKHDEDGKILELKENLKEEEKMLEQIGFHLFTCLFQIFSGISCFLPFSGISFIVMVNTIFLPIVLSSQENILFFL